VPRFSRLVNKKPKLSILRQLRLPPLRLQRLRQVPLQPKLRLLRQWNPRLAQRKHLLSRPGNKLPGFFPSEKSSPDFRWKTSFVREVVDHESRLRLEAARFRIEVLATQTTKVSSFSFPKTRRLTHRSEYERVKRDGITQRGKLLMLNVMPVENSGPWRAGFVTSARFGGAVVRNRVRRRLREIVRRHQHDLRQGVWFVIIARHEAAAASYGALEDEWLRLGRRASILL